jgi:hypothetical protein
MTKNKAANIVNHRCPTIECGPGNLISSRCDDMFRRNLTTGDNV